MASNIASAAMWAAVFTPTADEIAKEIVAEEARLRALEEKAYWEGWDKAVKEGVIKRLRNHEEGFSFFSTKTQDEQADLIESGELQIAAPKNGIGQGLGLVWADETREETKGLKYQENLKIIMNKVHEGSYRIVI